MLIWLALPVAARRGGGQNNQGSGSSAVLSTPEAETLTFMREEEKLARDVYLTLYDTWEAPIFSNIASAEQTHMDALENLLNKYGLPDPILGFGRFSNPELQALYDELVLRGQQSLLEALHVGALIEEVDIADLQEAVAQTSRPDLVQVYENLMRGSRNHLRSFVRQIENLGVVYVAQHLTQAEVDDIVNSPMERGRTNGNAGPPRRGR
jgi:hypothetical protein